MLYIHIPYTIIRLCILYGVCIYIHISHMIYVIDILHYVYFIYIYNIDI